jgi:hypothetical protein
MEKGATQDHCLVMGEKQGDNQQLWTLLRHHTPPQRWGKPRTDARQRRPKYDKPVTKR